MKYSTDVLIEVIFQGKVEPNNNLLNRYLSKLTIFSGLKHSIQKGLGLHAPEVHTWQIFWGHLQLGKLGCCVWEAEANREKMVMHVWDDMAWWDFRRRVSSRAAGTGQWCLSAFPGEAHGEEYIKLMPGCSWASVQECCVLGSLVTAEAACGAAGKKM